MPKGSLNFAQSEGIVVAFPPSSGKEATFISVPFDQGKAQTGSISPAGPHSTSATVTINDT